MTSNWTWQGEFSIEFELCVEMLKSIGELAPYYICSIKDTKSSVFDHGFPWTLHTVQSLQMTCW